MAALKIVFPTLRLSAPAAVSAQHVRDLARRIDVGEWPPPFVVVDRVRFAPLRELDVLMAALELGETDDFRMLEWLVVLRRKGDWDTARPEHAGATSAAIWKAAVTNNALRRLLYRKLCLHWVEKAGMAESLVRTFEAYCQLAPKSHELACQFLKLLKKPESAPVALAELSLKAGCPPDDLRSRCMMPTRLKAVDLALEHVASVWIAKATHSPNGETWLMACIEAMDQDQEIKTVERILTGFPREEAGRFGKLVKWLKERFSPTGEGLQRSRRLSGQARAALRDWIGAVNYTVFERLIRQLLSSDWVRCLNHEREINQLNRRCAFWSNYSHRFTRIRILLTRNASMGLNLEEFDAQDLAQLSEHDIRYGDSTTPTEVCIFDFDDWLVVEFFRGPGSETILVPATEDLRTWLFERTNLTVKRIRYLCAISQPVILDHAYGWQNHSERQLAKRQTYPNEGQTRFKVNTGGERDEYWAYNVKTGLNSRNSAENDYKRESGLEAWQRTVTRLNREALQEYNRR